MKHDLTPAQREHLRYYFRTLLWPRYGESESAGLRRARRSEGFTYQRHFELAIRLASSDLSRYAFPAEGTPVLNLEPRPEIPAPLVEAERNLLRKLDSAHREQRPYQPELDARISSYELAAGMQLQVSSSGSEPGERSHTRSIWPQRSRNCFLWTPLSDGSQAGGARCQVCAAIYRRSDLRFTRAGGTKGGYTHGATDEIGFKAEQGRVSVHDFHATILHLLGLNHRDLMLERHGLKERLTDQFPARPMSEILAQHTGILS